MRLRSCNCTISRWVRDLWQYIQVLFTRDCGVLEERVTLEAVLKRLFDGAMKGMKYLSSDPRVVDVSDLK